VEDTGGLFSIVVESCTLVGLDGIKVGATNCVGEKFKLDNNLLVMLEDCIVEGDFCCRPKVEFLCCAGNNFSSKTTCLEMKTRLLKGSRHRYPFWLEE
jgi:hypothetical protein